MTTAKKECWISGMVDDFCDLPCVIGFLRFWGFLTSKVGL